MSDQTPPQAGLLGLKLPNPTKLQLATEISVALGIDVPSVSRGSSVASEFLDRVYIALTGDGASKAPDAYRKTERVLQALDLTYDPFWDTSESSATGGSTVTNRAYSRMRSAITRVPRCFILNVTDAPAGARWEVDHHQRYRYDETVTGRAPLNGAGPGSRIIYYSTSKSKAHPKHFVAHAEIEYIGPGWTGPWEASIYGYEEFSSPVLATRLAMPGWNHQHAITEVSFPTFADILRAGGTELGVSTILDDPGGAVVAKRVLHEIPLPRTPGILNVPHVLPGGHFASRPAVRPVYSDTVPGTGSPTPDFPRSSNSLRNKLAEIRAVDLTRQALEHQGWNLARDCQKDGTGYDLVYVRAGRELHVEVKGVIATTLAFNLTPKESWRAEQDPAFVVVAVTNVLSPTAFVFHVLTRRELATASRTITGYRLRFLESQAR